jgi:hypothetical protein
MANAPNGRTDWLWFRKLKFLILLAAVAFGYWLGRPARVVRAGTAQTAMMTQAYITRFPAENDIAKPMLADQIKVKGTAVGVSCAPNGEREPGGRPIVDCFVLSR